MTIFAHKYDTKTKKYTAYELPQNAVLYADDVTQKCACAACGKECIIGDCYTSKEIHTELGMGFLVCADCYEKELARAKDSQK